MQCGWSFLYQQQLWLQFFYYRAPLTLNNPANWRVVVGDKMGAFQTKTDFQSLLVVSCLMFDLEHLIRVILQFIITRQAREYRDIASQSGSSRLKDSDTQVSWKLWAKYA